MLSSDVLDAIGHTPLVRLRLGEDRGVEVYAKLEMHNLFAMKDRVAKRIIADARASGALPEGAPIVESSSGTMALGVALVGTALGHPVHIVTDPRIDRITLAKLEALGATVHVVAAMDARGWQGARLTRLAELMAEQSDAFWPRQYENPQNPAAYRALADELIADLDRIDAIVGSVGSGGSLCGTSRVLRERRPRVRVIGVDAVGSVLFGQPDWPARLQSGLGNSVHPANLDHDLVDEVHWLNDREAFGATRELARVEKLFAGNTSGSVYRVLAEVARHARSGDRIVGIFPDRGDRYADTVHSDDYWAAKRIADLPLAARPRQVVAGAVVRSWSYRVDSAAGDPPKFVFVESNTTGTGMLALTTAAALGFEPVLATADPDRYTGLADTGATVVECDVDNPGALRAALLDRFSAERITGVTTTSEFAVTAAACLAADLGLVCNPAEAVAACRDKGGLRAVLAVAGIRQPEFRLVRDGAEVEAAVRRVGLPCVVKPVAESGSTGVLRCDTVESATAHAASVVAAGVNLRGQPVPRVALVERFLDAPEFSVEMFGVDGEHRLVGIVEKTLARAPHFVESRHLLPADLPAEVAEEVESTVRKALTAVGLICGPSHTEVKLEPGGAAIVEINPRLAGGMIPELFRLAAGCDLLADQVRHAAGLPTALPDGVSGHAGIQFLLPAETGVLAGVRGVEQAASTPGISHVRVTVAPGRWVAPPVDAYGRIGHVIACGQSRAEVVDALDKALELITIDVR